MRIKPMLTTEQINDLHRLYWSDHRPIRKIERHLLKADSCSVTIYDRVHEIVSYARSWRRGQTFGAERFEAELAEFRRPPPGGRAPKTGCSLFSMDSVRKRRWKPGCLRRLYSAVRKGIR
jgi:hypothetical protein